MLSFRYLYCKCIRHRVRLCEIKYARAKCKIDLNSFQSTTIWEYYFIEKKKFYGNVWCVYFTFGGNLNHKKWKRENTTAVKHTYFYIFLVSVCVLSVSPESIVIPIVSCIFGFPLLALLVICCLRHRAKMARERDRRRNYDLQDHAVSLVRFSPIHRLSKEAALIGIFFLIFRLFSLFFFTCLFDCFFSNFI